MTLLVGDAGAPRLAVILHGILGSGRNWRGVARALADRFPAWRFALPDLRNHAGSLPRARPHTIAACAADLQAGLGELGVPELVVGHSFGGKVALAWCELYGRPSSRLQVLDCAPGRSDPRGADTLGVLDAVLASPVPSEDRAPIREFLRARGISEPVVAWLATSLVRGPEGWRWGYDLPGIQAMLADFFETDSWKYLQSAATARIRFLRAERSDRWPADELARFGALPADSRVSLDLLSNAGHWVHVDDPTGTLRWMSEDLR